MLQANKDVLQADTRVNLISIRQRELTLYTDNLRNLSTVGVILAGIAFYGLIYTKKPYYQEASQASQAAYVFSLTVVQGLAFHVSFGATLITILGPGRALRCSELGDMHIAVDSMREESKHVRQMLLTTVYGCMAVMVTYAWLGTVKNSIFTSVLLTCCAILSVLTLAKTVRTIRETFKIPVHGLNTGVFHASNEESGPQHAGAGAAGSASRERDYQALPQQEQRAAAEHQQAGRVAVVPDARPRMRPPPREGLGSQQTDLL